MKLKPKGLAAAGMAITLFLSPGAWAGESDNDELSVQPLVVTTTMTKKSIKEAPGSVEVITRQNLEDMNAQTLADAVENAVGLVVTTETGRNKRPSIRGTGAKHTLILIDGRRIASGFKSYTGMEQIPVDMIDHIEVVRGPASALYGSDAMGGVINVITRKTPDKFTLEATGELGQTTYAEGELGVGQALVGGGFGDLGFLLSGSYRHKDGYDRDNTTPDDQDDSSLGSVAGRVSYDISKFHHLLTGFEYMEKNAQGLRDIQNMDRERDAEDERLNLFLEYNGKLSPVSKLMLRANHSTHEADIEMDPPTSMTPGAIGDEGHSKRRLDQLEGRFTSLFFDRHMVTIGAEGREEERKDDSGLAHDITNLSFLVQDEYQITDRFYLLLGGRVDEHSDFGSHFSPRASATFALMENFRIKTSAGKGFRAPDINELFIPVYMKRGKIIYQPNSDLDPEESTSFELSLEGEIQKFHGRITGFQNDINDLIEPVFDYTTGSGKRKKDYYIYNNISKARMRGIEMEAGIDLPLGFDIAGNLTFLDAENKDTGESLENRPDISGFVKLGYASPDLGIRTSFRLTYIGEREFDAGNETAVTRADFRISKKLSRQMEFYTGVNNIANAYVDDGLEPMSFYAGLNFCY
jgi:outer membrane receptor for ferrienterochelin and colicins